MNRNTRGAAKILDRFFARVAKPSPEQVDSSRRQVWQRLTSKLAGGQIEIAPLVDRRVDVRASLRPLMVRIAIAGAIVAAGAVVVVKSPVAIVNRAIAENLEGTLYRVADGESHVVGAGEKIEGGSLIRSDGGHGALVALEDGSRLEMRSESELSLERADNGIRIRLSKGGVIVNAAKPASAPLYVQTKDISAAVVGSVSVVNAEEQGSRVAVIQGEVRVQQGSTEKKLRPGEQVATNPAMEPVPMVREVAWSREAESHVALLQLLQQVQNITRPTDTPKWEVVSVRPCQGPTGGARGGGGGGGVGSSPGRLRATCMPLMFYLEIAYVRMAEPQFKPQWNVPISGGPSWIHSDPYTIEAKAEGLPSAQMLEGPMFQALLEDRFKLKIHRETRDAPVYFLTVAPGGPKLEAVVNCVPFDSQQALVRREARRRGEALPRNCGALRIGRKAGGIMWDFDGATVTDFALNLHLDRPVFDKTGITGVFRFHLEFSLDSMTANFLPGADNGRAWQESTGGILPIDDPGAGPPLRTAIQEQLGLKLEPTRGPANYLIIDGVDRPIEN
jgi:uncharacterized protein (TIGR03435 family)